MAVGDVYRMVHSQIVDSSIQQNTTYMRKISAGDATAAQLLTFANAFKEVLRPHQTTSLAWDEWTAVQMVGSGVVWQQPLCRPVGGLAFNGDYTGTLTGARVDERGPPQNAIVHTLRTGLVGRRRRGRVYQAGITQDQYLGGVVTASEVTALAAKWATFLGLYGPTGSNTDFRFGQFSWLIASGCVVNPNPPPTHLIVASPNPSDAERDITDVVVKAIIYTQRRRTLGVGQ